MEPKCIGMSCSCVNSVCYTGYTSLCPAFELELTKGIWYKDFGALLRERNPDFVSAMRHYQNHCKINVSLSSSVVVLETKPRLKTTF